MSCPRCEGDYVKVIYAGFPAKLCTNRECYCLFGFWADVIAMLPFNGLFMEYTGSYWKALWHFVRDT